jgi:flavin-dependent dehydrogenase
VKHVDVAIIGASLAGSACVRELTRLGIDAVAIDRDHFPREKVCGGFLSPGAVDLLSELDLTPAIRSAGASTVRSSTIRMRDRTISVELPREGLGISRRVLDKVMADHPAVEHGHVRRVSRERDRFHLQLDGRTISARTVIDAAGKSSRFSRRRVAAQFGVQYYEAESHGEVLDFWFFNDGYGGAVTVEGGRSNACFLINKDALPRFLHRKDCLVTGPVSYERESSELLSIGDAAGMVDPFCGEGMRHALDTGISAARIVARGLHKGTSYETIRADYEQQTTGRWLKKRRLGRMIRAMLRYPRLTSFGFGFNPEYWFRQLWS